MTYCTFLKLIFSSSIYPVWVVIGSDKLKCWKSQISNIFKYLIYHTVWTAVARTVFQKTWEKNVSFISPFSQRSTQCACYFGAIYTQTRTGHKPTVEAALSLRYTSPTGTVRQIQKREQKSWNRKCSAVIKVHLKLGEISYNFKRMTWKMTWNQKPPNSQYLHHFVFGQHQNSIRLHFGLCSPNRPRGDKKSNSSIRSGLQVWGVKMCAVYIWQKAIGQACLMQVSPAVRCFLVQFEL